MTIPKDILREQTASCLRLANQVFLTNPGNNNVILSPLSIHVALSMVAAGAGRLSKEQIVSFLGANSEEQLHEFASNVTDFIFSNSSVSSDGPKLSTANAIWLKDSLTFKSSFKQTVETDYKAVTKLIDFTKVDESVAEVNAWAEQATNGLIKDLIDPIDFEEGTLLVLANALYFNATWVDMFDADCTSDDTFHIMDGSCVDVPFMSDTFVNRAIGTYDTFKVLNLPYCKGEDKDKRSFSMSIFLPNDKDGLPSLLQRVCNEGTSFLDRHIPKTTVNSRVRIPLFKIEFNSRLMKVLKQLGLNCIESLTEVVEQEQEPVLVSNILHKAFIEVNEAGTEAAAVTVDEYMSCSMYDTPVVYVDFIADHPFMFVIREDSTGLVLFVGRVLNPAS